MSGRSAPPRPDTHAERAHHAIASLLDDGTFDPWIGKQNTRVQCAGGTIGGQAVATYSVEAGRTDGAIGPDEADQIIAAGEHAWSKGIPLISIDAVLSPRVDAGLEGFHACERIARESGRLSGRVPQIALLTDPSSAAQQYLSMFADLIVATTNATGAAEAAHYVAEDFVDASQFIKQLVHLLPATDDELHDALRFTSDGGDRRLTDGLCETLRGRGAYDVLELIGEISDQDSFVELDAGRGSAMVVGLAKIYSQSVGFCASQTLRSAALDQDALDKAIALADLCDRFSIPVVNLVDTGEELTQRLPLPGEAPGPSMMRRGAALMRARMMMAPCVSLVVRRCYGAGYLFTTATRPHHAVIAYGGAQMTPEGVEGPVSDAYERGWVKKVIDPAETVEALVHWVRWSRAERARVTSQLRRNDRRLYNV